MLGVYNKFQHSWERRLCEKNLKNITKRFYMSLNKMGKGNVYICLKLQTLIFSVCQRTKANNHIFSTELCYTNTMRNY